MFDSGFLHLLGAEASDRCAEDLGPALAAEVQNTVAAPAPAIVACIERS